MSLTAQYRLWNPEQFSLPWMHQSWDNFIVNWSCVAHLCCFSHSDNFPFKFQTEWLHNFTAAYGDTTLICNNLSKSGWASVALSSDAFIQIFKDAHRWSCLRIHYHNKLRIRGWVYWHIRNRKVRGMCSYRGFSKSGKLSENDSTPELPWGEVVVWTNTGHCHHLNASKQIEYLREHQ